MKVNIIGPLFGTSGYNNHMKGLVNALGKIIDVKISTQLFNGWELQCNDLELEMINKQDDKDRINIIIDLPFNWNQYCNKKKNVAYLVWEGDKIPLSWVDCITNERITQVWVPSSHVYNAIKNTIKKEWDIIKNKIKIIPHGVDLNIFQQVISKKEILTFICNKGFRGEDDRGGIQHSLKAFIQEFNKGEARLLLKINPAYTLPIESIAQIIQKYQFDAGKPNDKMPEILIRMDNLNQNQLSNLYNEADVFLNATEGEAFSLCALESMACGLPTISTNFGGQTDFVTNENGWLIDYELKPVEHELMYEGVSWAKPNIEQLRKAMRECCNPEIIKEKGNKALNNSKDLTWDNTALKSQEALNEIKED